MITARPRRTETAEDAVMAAAVAVAFMRITLPATSGVTLAGAYQAFAHLFVGALIGAWFVSRDKFYGAVAVVLALVEVIVFLGLKWGNQ